MAGALPYDGVVFLTIRIHLGNIKIGIIYLTLVSGLAGFYFLNTCLFYSWKVLSRLPSRSATCTSLEHAVTGVGRSLNEKGFSLESQTVVVRLSA